MRVHTENCQCESCVGGRKWASDFIQEEVVRYRINNKIGGMFDVKTKAKLIDIAIEAVIYAVKSRALPAPQPVAK